MGPLDRFAFRVIIALALHATLAGVASIGAALLAAQEPAMATLFGFVAVVNAALGLRQHLRLGRHLQRHSAH